MIDFNLDNEQKILRDGVERYIRENYRFSEYKKIASSEEGFQRDHWNRFAELGWLGLCVAEDMGGLARPFLDVAVVMEEFGRGLVREPFVPTTVLCAKMIGRADHVEVNNKLLKGIAAGKLLTALAHSEDGARFELASVKQTTAIQRGSDLILNGVKTVVLGGPSADLLIVSAAVGDDTQGRFALYLVDPRSPGVSMQHYPLIDGSRASDVRLHDVRVAPEAMLIGPDKAFAALDEAIDLATLATVAEALGCMEAILELTREHLATRVQFGQPLGEFQALQHRMAEMFIEVQETRSILYQGITNLDKGDAKRRIAVSAAKAYAGNAGKFVGAQGIQLHGGIGVTEEAQVGHYYKKLVLFEKLFGDCDYHVNRFADDWPLQDERG